MRGGRDVYLTWDGGGAYLRGHSPGDYGLFVSGDGIEGWESSPEAKVSMTEMQAGDGAYPVDGRDVLYSARTVSINFHAHGRDRSHVQELMAEVSRACHRIVELRVVDAYQDTFCTGYVQPEFEAEWHGNWATGVLTVVCADPRRRATDALTFALAPGTGSDGGVVFDSGGCLAWDVRFGGESGVTNTATMTNGGTSTAYPVMTAVGDFPDGFRIVCSDGGEISYPEPLSWQPVRFDSLTRTASINGVDVTRRLSSRHFPTVPPGGSATVSLFASGNGAVEVEVRDTYI